MLKKRSNAWGLACAAVALALLALYSVRTYGLNTQEKPSKPGGTNVSPRRSPSAGLDQETAAYAGIPRITDPVMRLEAMKTFVADFPGSSRLGMVQNQILDMLVRHFPDQKEEIIAQAKLMIDAAPEKGSMRSPGRKTAVATRDLVCNSIATKLMAAGVLLDQAETIARLGLRSLGDFETKGSADGELSRRFQKTWAAENATLGQICLKEGKFDEAGRVLKKSYKIDPALAVAAAGLGELAQRNGKYEQALGYFASAVLTGRSSEGVRTQLESVYSRLHDGSLDGLEEMLDAVYRKEFPPPMRVERYRQGPAQTRRVVLAEVFTGSGCPSCVAADLAIEGAMQRYSPPDFAVLIYHIHIPQPDPMANPSTLSRSAFYGVKAVPSAFIDGAPDGRGGGSREDSEAVYERFNSAIEDRLEVAPGARITLETLLKGSEVHVKAAVDQVRSESRSLRLQIALVEDELRYTGENGIRLHPMVVRSLGAYNQDETHRGFPVAATKVTSVEYTFDLAEVTAELKAHLDDYELNGRDRTITFRRKMHEIDPDRLLVVAFVQDESTSEVLQARSTSLFPRY